ncbi:hypothetical protein [Rhodococcus sp. NPDC003383]
MLWNGNIEPPLHTVFTDPAHIVRWAWSTHPLTAQRVAEVVARRPEFPVIRLTGRREVDAWVRQLRPVE